MGFYFDFENADAFVTGAIGRPGERTFYLQVRAEGRTISIKCEKEQVRELAKYLRTLLNDLPDAGGAARFLPTGLEQPVDQDFILGSIGLGIDHSNARMVVQLEEMVMIDEDDDVDDSFLVDEDEDDLQPSAAVRVLITPAQAHAFCESAESVVDAGRAPCKLCGAPKNPSGHFCPRLN